ncbi:pseudouridine synthase, partial [uncultured Fibrobacter sp.]|uniref:RluA family pseudouridine synthase n=1 Tax=uncultured Fibrobacter sp. TaxID=261512 RepID=UPI00260ABF97
LAGGFVSVNGAVATLETVAHRGDKVVYHVTNYTEPEVPTDFEIVFEDDEFMLVAKPAGVPVHHTGHIFYNTFTSIVRRGTDCETATPMHRLDRDTGGLMLFAKYAESAARFQKNLDRILLKKFYMAVVRGDFAVEGTPAGDPVDCTMPLREDPADRLRLRMHHFEDGKPCHTRFRKVGVGELSQPVGGETKYSVVEAELLTGRKHQIRAHLAELGYPILGDRLYSFDGIYYEKMSRSWERGALEPSNQGLSAEDLATLGGNSHMLYAYKVEIRLPYWMESRAFECNDYPEDMAELVRKAHSDS